MKCPIFTLSVVMSALTLTAAGARAQPTRAEPLPAPRYSITLGARDACVTPCTRNRARADGGIIDVQAPAAGVLNVTMTGTPAADSYLGCTSSAVQTFRLVQEFEVSCSDPSVNTVSLALESTLVGYVRSFRKAGACARLAGVTVTPASWSGSPLTLSHPALCVSGTEGRLCNQHLPPVQGPPMPLGRYVLVADFVLDATASGICNAHAVADFSPDTSLPADWVRTRDPFQGASKKSFGFTMTLTAGPPSPATISAAAATSGRAGSAVHRAALPAPARVAVRSDAARRKPAAPAHTLPPQ
jgi:hypothetical protein